MKVVFRCPGYKQIVIGLLSNALTDLAQASPTKTRQFLWMNKYSLSTQG